MVLNWHSSGDHRTNKPVVRRPMTACAPCRTAKVRCNGKAECGRCASKGLRCVYRTAEARAGAPAVLNEDSPSSSSEISPTTDGMTERSTDGQASSDSSLYTTFNNSLDLGDGVNFMDWSDENMFTHALEELNWELPGENALEVGPVDLVCIVSVFQQTAGCLGYITKSMVHSTVKVSVGDYEISVADDATTKRMLVLNLVNQASRDWLLGKPLINNLSELSAARTTVQILHAYSLHYRWVNTGCVSHILDLFPAQGILKLRILTGS
ncbi:hypothetical protein GE09DRAFT_1222342 [Coniochaeta sp. 2T2.1]|nr:hypothetical protein GE09DRAFT_1222342 [Coniochaeta sp. 2T2.1]